MANILLLIMSILIYASFGLKSLIFIVFSALSTYLAAKYMYKNKKLIFYSTLIINILILVFFKIISFNNFLNISILVPLGISYYTFSVLGYLIDIYKEKYQPEKSIFNYFLFVMYIPYLFIGPISRYDQISKTLYNKRTITKDNFFNGLIRVAWGLFKKYVIAGRIAIIISTISSNPEAYFGSYVFLALILYSFELYNDFSGGIDMVLGFSKILGIELSENFNSPYLSENLREFWRKWHISLSTWFKDYVYIPLGGNKCSKIRNRINLIITFIVSGLWHGINYFFWGLFHGIIVAFTPKEKSDFKVLNITLTFLIVSFLWVFFIYPDSLTSFKMLFSIFYKFNGIDLINNITKLGLNIPNLIIMIVTIIIGIIVDIKHDKLKSIYNLKIDKKLIIILSLLLITLLLGIYGLGFEKSNFIYSKF